MGEFRKELQLKKVKKPTKLFDEDGLKYGSIGVGNFRQNSFGYHKKKLQK